MVRKPFTVKVEELGEKVYIRVRVNGEALIFGRRPFRRILHVDER